MRKLKSKKIASIKSSRTVDLCVVGGAGHVGLPLAIAFAATGLKVLVYDVNLATLKLIGSGTLPFLEVDAKPLLRKALQENLLVLSHRVADVRGIPKIVITIGTPVDEFTNPDTKVMKSCVDELLPYLSNDQLIVLRSTVYPGTTSWLDKYLKSKGKRVKLAFCPERVVQGYAIKELQQLPQIVSGVTKEAEAEAVRLFRRITSKTVCLLPIEAEFAKLLNNAYRYIQFAITNQFYMIVNSAGIDYDRVLKGMKKDYPRAADIPAAGLAAGPCLLKDTMQLAAFSDNQFSLGHAAMIINEGLVLYLVGQMEKRFKLDRLVVGLLGMAFKADSDDTRASLSYKLKKVLMFHAKEVLTTDPHVHTDSSLLPVNKVIEKSDLLILCVPHAAYKNLNVRGKPLIDIWGYFHRGTLV